MCLGAGGQVAVRDIAWLKVVGREPLEERQKRHREIVGKVEIAMGRQTIVHNRLRQPGTDVRFSLGFEPAQPIDREPSRGPDEPRLRVVDAALVRLMPAEIRLLHDVLGVGAGAEHPVRQTKQAPPERFEHSGRGVRPIHHPFVSDSKTCDRAGL